MARTSAVVQRVLRILRAALAQSGEPLGTVALKQDGTLEVVCLLEGPQGGISALLDLEIINGLVQSSVVRAQAAESLREAILERRGCNEDAALFLAQEALLHAASPWRLTARIGAFCLGRPAGGVSPAALVCSKKGSRFARVPGVLAAQKASPPGIRAAAALREISPAAASTGPGGVILPAYGFLAGASSCDELQICVKKVLSNLQSRIRGRRKGKTLPGTASRKPPSWWEDMIEVAVPSARGALGENLSAVLPAYVPSVARILNSPVGAQALSALPACFDELALLGPGPLAVKLQPADPPERRREKIASAVASYRKRTGEDPRVLVLPEGGILTAGRTAWEASLVRRAFEGLLNAALQCEAAGGILKMPGALKRSVPPEWIGGVRASLPEKPAGRVSGKIAIVTGAAQGVGRHIALELAAQGATVMVVDLNARGAEGVCEEIRERWGRDRAYSAGADVRDEAAMRRVILQAVQLCGGLDIMIANAGVLKAFKITEFPVDLWRWIVDVNLVGSFVCAKVAAQVMRHQKRGDIIQINSKSGKKGSKYNSAYAASKFGGIGLVQSIALDLIEDGIKVNAICPGNFFDLPLWSAPGGLFDQYRAKYPGATREDVRRIYEKQIPMGRGCTVPDVMKTIYYILEQDYETGQAYNVTGGQEMR